MKPRPDSSRLRVAIVVETFATSFQRSLADAIGRHARFEADWETLFLEELHTQSNLEHVVREWAPDGIISWRCEPWLIDYARRVPVVALSPSAPADFPGAVRGNDDELLGRWAADYFLDRGYGRLGVFGSSDPYARLRHEGFHQRAQEAGRQCDRCIYQRKAGKAWNWEQRVELTCQWLATLAPPVGIYLTHDSQAARMVEACRRLSRRIPEDVAILGTGNDELQCKLVRPALSSVEMDGFRIGSQAARTLDDMRADHAPSTRRLYPPLRIVERGSTDSLAIEDPRVVEALRFLRDHFGEAIGVEDLAAQVRLSRRSVERRFERWVGRSPGDELRRLRIDQAKRLLLETTLPIAQIAQRCGYRRPERLSTHFRQVVGKSPREFRGEPKFTPLI